MQLASTASDDATAPVRRSGLRKATDRAFLPAIIYFLAALAAIEGRLVVLAHRDLTQLLRIGTVFGHPGHVPHGVYVFAELHRLRRPVLLPDGAGSGEPAHQGVRHHHG